MRRYSISATGKGIVVDMPGGGAAVAFGSITREEAEELVRRGNLFEEMLTALEYLRDQEYNSFEPDNQSKRYGRLCALVEKCRAQHSGEDSTAAGSVDQGSGRPEAQQP